MESAHNTSIIRPDVDINDVRHIYINEEFGEFKERFKKAFFEGEKLKSYLISLNRLKREHKDFIKKLSSVLSEEYYREVIYCLLFDIDELPICPICHNYLYLRNWKKGFQKFCCPNCKARSEHENKEFAEKIRKTKMENRTFCIPRLDEMGVKYDMYPDDANYIHIFDYCKHHDHFKIYKTQLDRILDHGHGTLCKECNQEIYNDFEPTEEEFNEFVENWNDFFNPWSQGANKDTWITFFPKEKKMLDIYYARISNGKDAEDCEKYYCIRNKLTSLPVCAYDGCNKHTKYIRSARQYNLYCDNHKNAFHGTSLFENGVFDYVKTFPYDVEKNARYLLDKRELDIYIPELRFAIECNGTFYHTSYTKDINYHTWKYNRCKELDIKLLSLWSDSWESKPDVCKSIIDYNIGFSNAVISSDDCICVILTQTEINKFITNNHLYRYENAEYGLGLTYNGDLKAVITYNIIDNHIDAIQYVLKLNHYINNGFTIFILEIHNRHKDVSTIDMLVDSDIYDGSEQESIGMKYIETQPHWMWFRSGKRYYQDEYTEEDISKYHLEKCYTAGNLLYRLDFNNL